MELDAKKIDCIYVKDFKDKKFLVPDYQRGYRWTEDEVVALLEDLKEAKEANVDYCLQPLIVLPREDGFYEVVDGQQRLTTIFIFMQIAKQEIRSASPHFSLGYGTRTDSGKFLEALSDDTDFNSPYIAQDIDYYHIANAYKVIREWLENQPDLSIAIQEMNTYIRGRVFFIWYKLPKHSDPIAIFTKVNLGKIPLTNAELIKALLLNKDNFTDRNDLNKTESISEQAFQIALKWDTIEQGLNEESFWYFLHSGDDTGTKIDLLFNLLAEEENEKNEFAVKAERNYFSFMVFYEMLRKSKNKRKTVESIWNKIEGMYSDFRHWYAEPDYFHLIGYLICAEISLRDIKKLTRGKKKSEVRISLINKAMETVKDWDKIGGVQYFERSLVRKILLLFNIATIYCENKQEYRFPFHIYKSYNWHIEHIHATANEQAEPDNLLWNLTLLTREINEAIKDKDLDKKRQFVLDYEAKGWFIPLCTRNVYLKAYTPMDKQIDTKDLTDWTTTDKECYLAKIREIFTLFKENKKYYKDDNHILCGGMKND